MNCQEAIERLPWWLNGSLEPEERREVEAHLAECASCREALKETRLAWEVYAQHVPIAALVAYAADERPEGSDPSLFERHLEDCPQCAAELEMARASRLLSEHNEVPLLVPRQTAVPARRPSRERGWQAAALAAGLTGLVAMGGWVGTVQQLHRSAAQLASVERETPRLRGGKAQAAPAAGGHSISAQLSADSVVRGETLSKPVAISLPKAGEATILLNHPADTPGEHAYKILDAQGRTLASGEGLQPSPLHSYLVTFDSKLLPPGPYTIQLSSLGSAESPTSFSFIVK
ncbi:MAG: putative zinc-finger [Acidobacteriota bacterium]|jgi:anti-sigma factor RsiW|nr:putative zinc-finger [Acidobacteriota bacterium]